MANKNINDLPTATSLNAGDKLEILQGGTNKQIDSSLLGAVQSVTGPQVDDTDPNNPIVNPLGLIKIVDLNGDFFTDLATASAYVATFNVAGTISDESFQEGVYSFTVPLNSAFSGADYFLGDFSLPKSAYIEDKLGLINILKDFAFYNSSGNNIIGNYCHFNDAAFAFSSGNNTIGNYCTFNDAAFAFSSGNNTIGDNCTFYDGAFEISSGDNTIGDFTLSNPTDYFGKLSTGKFIFNGSIGASTAAEYPNFFSGSTATIFAHKEAYTNNAGGIEGDLQTAISNGANVQFDGINLVTLKTAQTLTNKRIVPRVVSTTSAATLTFNVDTTDVHSHTLQAAALTIAAPTGTPNDKEIYEITVTNNGTANTLTFNPIFVFDTLDPAPPNTINGKALMFFFQWFPNYLHYKVIGWRFV